jgi:lysophospholipase L1-like esterase
MHTVSSIGSERATQGNGTKLVTRNGRTHVVWQEATGPATYNPERDRVEPGEYVNRVATFDHQRGAFTEPVTINHPVDNHARPNILMDREGYLHLIVSGHNSPVTYYRSTAPEDTSAWTDPVEIGLGTYPVSAIGPEGTIYVVMRSGRRLNGTNLYVRPKGGEWRKQCKLVHRDPDMDGYAAFHGGPVVAPDGTLHVVVNIYEGKGFKERRGLHQAICYMKSTDRGKTWTKADGTPVELPARPKGTDVIARDRAAERHEKMPPPLIHAAANLALDAQNLPHILYYDHRIAPGQVMHATTNADGEWRRDKVHALTDAFPGFRTTDIRNTCMLPGTDRIIALAELQPLDEMWRNGLPMREMNMDPKREKRLAWLLSPDGGRTWSARLAVDAVNVNCPTFEQPRGGNRLPENALPPLLYFDGSKDYPEAGETIQNNVYLVLPAGQAASRPAKQQGQRQKQNPAEAPQPVFDIQASRAHAMLSPTPGTEEMLRRAKAAGTLEIAPVHLPAEGAGPCNHFGWPIATRTGDTIVLMHRRIPGHHSVRGAQDDPNFSYGIVLRSDDGGQTWSEPYDLRDAMKPEDRSRGGNVPLSHRPKFDPDNQSTQGYKVHLHAIGSTRNGAVIAINNHGVFRSEDQGKTWRHFSKALREDTFPHEIVNLGPRIIDHPEHGLLVFGNWVTRPPSQKLVVLQSEDGGATWAVHEYEAGLSQYEPAALLEGDKVRFLTRNQDSKQGHEQMTWTPWEEPEVRRSNLKLGSVDTVDLSLNPATKRYEVVYSNRRPMEISLWSIDPDNWNTGEWKRECRLFGMEGRFYAGADGFHTAGAVIDEKRGIQHAFFFAGRPKGPAGIFRLTRSLDTPRLRKTARPGAPYRDKQAWRDALPERFTDHPAFVWAKPDPTLPNVLLLGDSISLGYTNPLRDRLANMANVFRAPANCRHTRQTLEQIEFYLGLRQWDVIHFNWGIHDITRVNAGGNTDPQGKPQVSPEDYRANLQRLVRRLKATGASLVWASTTPVAEGLGYRRNEDIDAYNQAAGDIMQQHGIRINDLNAVVRAHEKPLWTDGVHFTDEASRLFAENVADHVARELTHGLALEPLIRSELIAQPDADAGAHVWTLPLSNPHFPGEVSVSVHPAADNGAGWRVTAHPQEITLDHGEKRDVRIEAAAGPGEPRYPTPEVVLAVTVPAEDGQRPVRRSARKALEVLGSRPELTIRRAGEAPTLDGALKDAAWPAEPDIAAFGHMRGQRSVEPLTQAWIAYDATALYIAARCREPQMDRVRTEAKQRDEKVYLDDSLEILFDPAGDGATYYQIVINTAGVIFDSQRFNSQVDLAGLRSAAVRQAEHWILEVAVPWADLDLAGPPPEAGLLLGRNRMVGGRHEILQFPVSPKGNHQPQMFARVRFPQGEPAAGPDAAGPGEEPRRPETPTTF